MELKQKVDKGMFHQDAENCSYQVMFQIKTRRLRGELVLTLSPLPWELIDFL